MHRRRPPLSARLTLSATLALAFALVAGWAGADTVKLVPDSTVKSTGNQVTGQVTAETVTEVTVKPTSGAEVKVPVDQIESVDYDSVTPSYTLAQSRENVGATAEAAELFQKAAREAQGKPFVERAALYNRARALTDIALADPSKVADALASLDAFLKAHPNSRQVGPALENVVRLSLQKGDTARAEAALGELTSKVPSAAPRTQVLRARLLARQDKHDQAISALDQIIAAAPKGSAQAREAKLAKAEGLVGAKKYAEAEQVVRDVIQEAPPESVEIQAQAHNTLGDCLRAAGRPKDALIAYLKTDVLYDRDKEYHPRAMAMIAELWRELKQDDRAAEMMERLRQQYPQSPYATAPTVAPR